MCTKIDTDFSTLSKVSTDVVTLLSNNISSGQVGGPTPSPCGELQPVLHSFSLEKSINSMVKKLQINYFFSSILGPEVSSHPYFGSRGGGAVILTDKQTYILFTQSSV